MVRVFDTEYSEEFIARLQDIRSGNVKHGPKGRHEIYKKTYQNVKDKFLEASKKAITKYQVGDLFGDRQQIELLEIKPYTKNNHRIGKFFNHETGKVFECSINSVKLGLTQGVKYSKGEDAIAGYLSKLNISFEQQKRFQDCYRFYGNYLPFDFYLPDYNCCIEYDGEQHYKEI